MQPGQELNITLALSDPPATPKSVPFSGEVILPDGWGLPHLMIFIDNLDRRLNRRIHVEEIDLLPGQPTHFSWSVGAVPPGRYAVELCELGVRQVFDVGPDGKTDARIEVPPPGLVVLRFVDGETGDDCALDMLMWSRDDTEAVISSTSRESPRGRRYFLAPIGKIVVWNHHDQYAQIREEIEVRPGRNDRTITLDRWERCLFRLFLQENGESVPWDYTKVRAFRVEPVVEGSGRLFRAHGSEGNSALVGLVSRAGRYSVAFGIEGYETIPPFEIHLHPGEHLDHKVELRRIPPSSED